jgi:hypothetical protein
MQDKRTWVLDAAERRRVQRLVVLHVLREDHEERWSGCELGDVLAEVEAEALANAIDGLTREGVLCAEGDVLWASSALVRVSELELICVYGCRERVVVRVGFASAFWSAPAPCFWLD